MAFKMDKEEAEDCRLIVDILESEGYILTMEEAHELWSKHSDDYCAGWLITPSSIHDFKKELLKLVEIERPVRGIYFKQL